MFFQNQKVEFSLFDLVFSRFSTRNCTSKHGRKLVPELNEHSLYSENIKKSSCKKPLGRFEYTCNLAQMVLA